MLFEKRSVTVVPEDLWRRTPGAGPTPTGLTITPDNALNVTTVFQAIRFLSFMVASLPLITYQKSGEDRKRATRHPLYPLLHDAPNPEMTSFDLISLMASHVFGRGNACAEIQFDETGRVIAIWPLPINKIELVRNMNYELRYVVTLPDRFGAEKRVLRPDQVWHWRGLSKEGLWGLSVLAMHRNAIGLARAMEDYSGAYFGNNAEPGVVLRHPGELSEDAYDRITESWEQSHMGLNQSHRAAILEEGMEIEKIGFSPKDSMMLEAKQFQVIEIARMFGIPPHLLFELSNATFTNIEQQSLEFLIYHLRPWLVNFEQEIKRSLFLERERKAGYYAEFLVDAIERGDIATRFASYAIGLNNGFFTINDVLRKENMNTIGDQGDVRLVPMNMAVLGPDGMPIQSKQADANANPNTPASNGSRDLFTAPLLFDAAERILKREHNELTNARKRFAVQPDRFMAWVEEFYKRDYPEFIQLVLNPLVKAGIMADDRMQTFIESHCDRCGQMAAGLQQDDAIALPTPDEIANQLVGETHGNTD